MPFNFIATIKRVLTASWDWRATARALFMVGMLLALTTSLGKVMVNARNNNEVYEYEQENLSALEAEREKLQKELAYYESYEYKRLYARDYLNLAQPGERLYRIVDNTKLYDVRQRLYNYPEANFLDWWRTVL